MPRLKPNTTIWLDGHPITIHAYLKDLDCYRVTHAGPGHVISARLAESRYLEQQDEDD